MSLDKTNKKTIVIYSNQLLIYNNYNVHRNITSEHTPYTPVSTVSKGVHTSLLYKCDNSIVSDVYDRSPTIPLNKCYLRMSLLNMICDDTDIHITKLVLLEEVDKADKWRFEVQYTDHNLSSFNDDIYPERFNTQTRHIKLNYIEVMNWPITHKVGSALIQTWKKNKKYTLTEFMDAYIYIYNIDFEMMGNMVYLQTLNEKNIYETKYEHYQTEYIKRRNIVIALYKLPYPHEVKFIIGKAWRRKELFTLHNVERLCAQIAKYYKLKKTEKYERDNKEEIKELLKNVPFHIIYHILYEYVVGCVENKTSMKDIVFELYGRVDNRLYRIFKYMSFNTTINNTGKVYQTVYNSINRRMVYFYIGVIDIKLQYYGIYYGDIFRNIREIDTEILEIADLMGVEISSKWKANKLIIRNCKNIFYDKKMFKTIVVK
jgi:hypothetical protein